MMTPPVPASRTRAPVSGKSVGRSDLENAADVLLRFIVTGERQKSAAANPNWVKGRPWVDTLAPPSTDALDVSNLISDPTITACRAELRRIGHALHAANPGDDFVALSLDVAEMHPTYAGWRPEPTPRST